MNATKPYQLDTNGFPVIACPRCDGRGALPQYSKISRGVCFECDGTRLTYPTKDIATAAKDARDRLAAVDNPTAELLADINRAAQSRRTSYDRTLARREARASTRSESDNDASRLAAAIRDILNNNELDNIAKATAIRRLTYNTQPTSPASRRLHNDIKSIQRGWRAPMLPQHLDIIAIRIAEGQ